MYNGKSEKKWTRLSVGNSTYSHAKFQNKENTFIGKPLKKFGRWRQSYSMPQKALKEKCKHPIQF